MIVPNVSKSESAMLDQLWAIQSEDQLEAFLESRTPKGRALAERMISTLILESEYDRTDQILENTLPLPLY
jgi:hypothetical protein